MPDIKRLHYFNHQFLRAKDFTAEQNYHLDMRRFHNRLLHTWGIMEGLTVEFETGASGVTVRRGAAIDRQGREIVLTQDSQVELAGFTADADVYITIAYQEQQTDPTGETGVEGNTRWTETPRIETLEKAPGDPDMKLILARVEREGTAVKEVDSTQRRSAGVVGGDFQARSLTLTTPGVDPGLWPSMRGSEDARRVELDRDLRVAGNVDVEGNLTVTGTVYTDDLQPMPTDVNEPRIAGIAAGGLSANSLTLTTSGDPDLRPSMRGSEDARRVDLDGGLRVSDTVDVEGNLTVTGRVDGRDVAEDGGKLDAHVNDKEGNPHKVTAEAVGALVSVDGVSNPGGDIDLVANNAITISSQNRANRITIGENHSRRVDNPHNVTAEDVGALPVTHVRRGRNVDWTRVQLAEETQLRILGSTSGNESMVHFRNENDDARRAIFARVNGPTDRGARHAAVIGQSRREGVHGVFAVAPDGTHALFVRGSTNIQGMARVTGGIDPYLIDSVINASGQVLRTGDVVRLKGSPVSRFRGDNNKMPVPEVTLADKENDTAVIGIVDREAIPDPDEPDRRTDREDPTSIPEGGELFMVTLGAYAHCKVDATEASIEVGDLLTSSSNPGHAKKATEPKIGAIIGKALEPLEEGTGYIAVFVNLQ